MGMRVNRKVNSGGVKLSLIGRFDEMANLGDFKFGDIEQVVIDFSRVTMITSSGIRFWTRWVEAATKAYPKIVFELENCPSYIVEQASKIVGFLPRNVRIRSFQVEYYCDKCDRVEMRDYHVVKGKACKVKTCLPRENCAEPECPREMGMDVLPKKYFAFFKIQGDTIEFE